jgi:hypothetical protein
MLIMAALTSACGGSRLVAPPTLAPAVIEDLTKLAEQRDEPLPALVERHAGVVEVGELATELETEYPELFVRWGVSQPGEPGDYWFLLTAQPDLVMAARIAALPADVIVITGATATEGELSAIKGALISALARHPDVYAYSGTMTDRFASEITVEYGLTAQALGSVDQTELAACEAEALEAARRASKDGVLPVKVVFEQVFYSPPVFESSRMGG